MKRASVVIPNYNGIAYLENCMASLYQEDRSLFHIVVVDNGSTDGSEQIIPEKFPETELVEMGENTGFCKAVNAGIQATEEPYVILLNNDTVIRPGFVNALIRALDADAGIFSASAKMLVMKEPEKMDDAGDRYSAFGWAYARGKGEAAEKYERPCRIFASCGGAAIYRRSILEQIGLFDENHFAYLEDIDIGYRAKIYGYDNVYEPGAVVYHAGSAVSGSRYNAFKIRLSSRNSIYLIYKNMPWIQILLNLPFLLAGFGMKICFFTIKGYGGLYITGLLKGVKLCLSESGRRNKVHFSIRHLANYMRIQKELWWNLVLRKV